MHGNAPLTSFAAQSAMRDTLYELYLQHLSP